MIPKLGQFGFNLNEIEIDQPGSQLKRPNCLITKTHVGYVAN